MFGTGMFLTHNISRVCQLSRVCHRDALAWNVANRHNIKGSKKHERSVATMLSNSQKTQLMSDLKRRSKPKRSKSKSSKDWYPWDSVAPDETPDNYVQR